MRPSSVLGILSSAAVLCQGMVASASDWPQLQHDPQRSGYTSERLQPPFTVAWTKNFQPERVSGFVQPVISHGRLFVGTESGNLYGLNAATGRQLWRFPCGSPILQTAACGDDKVFLAALSGDVLALRADDGALAWRRAGRPGYGFSTAPLLQGGRLFIGGRDGTFYALAERDGRVLWTYRAPEPIFSTAAAGTDGMIFVAAEDRRLRAFDAATGQVRWRSDPLDGQTMLNTYPVVAGDTVLIRPMMNHLVSMISWPPDFTPTWDKTKFEQRYRQAKANGVLEGRMPQSLLKEQGAVEAYFRSHPEERDLFLLDAETGRVLPAAPHFRVNSMHGPVVPPAVLPDGSVIIPWTYLNHGWARLDLKERRAIEFIVPPRPTNADETLNVSIARNLVFIFHCEEANANYTGIYDLDQKQWIPFPEPPNRWGDLADNLESASHAVAIANGFFYHIVFHQLAAWKDSSSHSEHASNP